MANRVHEPEVYLDAVMANPHWSNVAIGEFLGVDESTVRRNLKLADYQRWLLPEDHVERWSHNLDKPLVLTGDWAITADWHIPLYDPVLVNKFIRDCRARGIRNILMAGDVFNADSLSQYFPKQHSAGLDREKRETVAVLRVLLESFDRIVWTWGNHDARFVKDRNWQVVFTEAMRDALQSVDGVDFVHKIEFSNLDHCYVESGGERFYVCHPLTYSQIPLTTARKLASKHHCHVITAHSHHLAAGWDVSGKYRCIEIGGFFDSDKTAYLQRSTTFPKWQQGYAIITDGELSVKANGWNI